MSVDVKLITAARWGIFLKIMAYKEHQLQGTLTLKPSIFTFKDDNYLVYFTHVT